MMNALERFRAVCRGQAADYVPVIGLPGASGLAFGGAWGRIYERLIETGMPAEVRGWDYDTRWAPEAAQSWSDFWGTLTPLHVDFMPAEPAPGIRSHRRREGAYEIIEYETGAVTRQVVDGDNAYSMPEFVRYHVRDRESWERYKRLNTPGPRWERERIEEACRAFDGRTKPAFISLMSTWGRIRDIGGTEFASTVLYDAPELAHDIVAWQSEMRRRYLFPLVERIRPEIVKIGEDCCYNHGMLIGPEHFRSLCAEPYREIVDLGRACGAEVTVVDTDGKIDDFLPVLAELGINGVYPIEAKANADLFALRRRFPEFIFFGWLEKEAVNEGNESLIEEEIGSKVPGMIARGRYFPNIDHSLQPMCMFANVCTFMARLHRTLGNPEGRFYDFMPDAAREGIV